MRGQYTFSSKGQIGNYSWLCSQTVISVCVCACENQRTTLGVAQVLSLLPPSPESSHLTWNSPSKSGCPTSRPWGLGLSSPSLGLQTYLAVFMWVLGLNSGLDACTASTLWAEPCLCLQHKLLNSASKAQK